MSVKYENVRPSNIRKEWFVSPSFNSPEWEKNADIVESGASDLRKVLFGLKTFHYKRGKQKEILTMKVW